MPLLELPNELLLSTADKLNRLSDFNAFTRTNKRLYILLNCSLYRRDVRRAGGSALAWAAENGLERTAELSLAEGTNVDAARGYQGPSPAHSTSFRRVRQLEKKPISGMTPLQVAIFCEHESLALLLIEQGADIKRTYSYSFYKCKPLHLASALGLTTTVQMLLDKGARVNVQDGRRRTPLHYAADPIDGCSRWQGNVETVKCLLQRGANSNTQDRNGLCPEDLLRQNSGTFSSSFLPREFDYFRDSLKYRHESSWELRKTQREQSHEAQGKIKQLLEAKRAANNIEKIERQRELSKKRTICAEARLRESLARKKREQRLLDRCRQEAEQRTREECEIANQKAKEERERAEQEAKAELERAEQAATINMAAEQVELGRIKRQEEACRNWSQLRAQAEQAAKDSTPPAILPPTCSHSPNGLLKCKARGRCQHCERICTKYSFRCLDCGSLVCVQCKQSIS
jgi:Ankyrin repeats (3 copies)